MEPLVLDGSYIHSRVYVKNRSPAKALKNRAPKEVGLEENRIFHIFVYSEEWSQTHYIGTNVSIVGLQQTSCIKFCNKWIYGLI